MAGKQSYWRRGSLNVNDTMHKRKQGKVCAFCGRKIKVHAPHNQDVFIRPDLNGMGRDTRAHASCAQKAGVF